MIKQICPRCKRLVLVEDGFYVTHREDPPATVICSNSGTAVQDWYFILDKRENI